jgi:hypothetical protein
MRVLSAVQNGVYDEDPHSDVDPEMLMRYYDIDEVPGSFNHHASKNDEEDDETREETDNSEDEDEEDLPELEFKDQDNSSGVFNANSDLPDVPPATVVEEMQAHIRHPPVKVPRHSNPFIGMPEREQAFISVLNSPGHQNDHIPMGLGVFQDEWDEGGYPTHQILKIGARRREHLVELPAELWLPRARRWARGINILYQTLDLPPM